MKRYYDLLLTTPLFSGIAKKDLDSLLNCLSASIKKYSANEVVFNVGAKNASVGILCSGELQITQGDFWGNRTILNNINVGELFGETFACIDIMHIPVSVIAKADCEIIMIDYRKVISTCPASCSFHTKVIKNMLTILANKNIMLNHKLEVLSKRSTREKLIAYLSLQALKAQSSSFTIPFDRQELADFLCVDRSAMSNELGKMRKEGLLTSERNMFEVLWG